MDILEIDCVSYATRVGYSASFELLNLLNDEPEDRGGQPAPFLPIDLDGDDLEDMVIDMGTYVCKKGCESGERMFRWLSEKEAYDKPWEETPQEIVLALETFVFVCSKTYTKLHCLQIGAERRAQRPVPTLAPKIEDTIFEPIGSMAELEPHAEQAMKAWDDSARRAASASGESEPHAALSLGETVQSGSGEGQDNSGDLPTSPKTPAQRKASRKGKKASK
ncbi:hypothetical protein IWQ51_001721 [Labrenzia sp. EL_142]|nr:hypothetical protein [Labrenzia sp. EL_142]